MDPNSLLTEWIESGKELLGELAETGHTVLGAFWGRDEETSPWYLYVVAEPTHPRSGGTISTGLREAMARIKPLSAGRLAVRLVSPEERMAKGLMSLMANPSYRKLPRGHTHAILGQNLFDEIYVYDPPATAAPVAAA